MASGLHRRDSIGKADQGHDIYSVVRNPHAHGPSKPHQIKPLGTDRLETSAEKMQRQQMESIKMGYLRIMQEDGSAIKLIAVTAKYMFMAAVFPPYLLLYILPEFIFVKMLPKLFKETMKLLERLPDWFSNTAAWMPNPNQLLSLLVKPFAIGQQSLQDFLQMMKHYSQSARNAVADRLKQGLELAKIPFMRTAQILSDAASGLKEVAKTIGKEAVKINDKIEHAIQAVKDNIAAIVVPLVQPIVEYIDAKYTYAADLVKKGYEFASQTLYRTIERVKGKLMPPIEKSLEMAQDVSKWVSSRLYMAAQPVIAWAQPKLDKAKQMAKRAAKEIDKVRQKMQEAVHSIKENIVSFAAPMIVHGQNLINLMITAPIVRLFKKREQRKSFKGQTKQFAQKFKGMIFSAQTVISQKIRKTVSFFGRLLAIALLKIKDYLVALPRKMLDHLILFGKASVRFAKATGSFLVKTYQVTKLLLQFGMQLMRELKAELSLYFKYARTET